MVGNVGKLNGIVATLQYKPEDLANGASDLIEEVQNTKITGEEEAFSHIDLVDFAGNVEGAQQAYASLRPGLEKIDGNLVKQIDQQFQAVLERPGRLPRPVGAGRLPDLHAGAAGQRRTEADRGDPAAASEPVHGRAKSRHGQLTWPTTT